MSTPEITAYDVLPVGVAVIEKSLKVCTWNATLAKWTGVAPNAAIGRRLDEFLPGFNSERFSDRLASVFNDGQSVVLAAALRDQVFPLRKADGQTLFHKVHASASACGLGKALLVVEDVTTSVTQLNTLRAERRRLKDSERSLRQQQQELTERNVAIVEARSRAEKANLAKSEFLANMSHEVRTPLTAIKGFSEAVLGHSESAFVHEAAERVVRNADHLLSVVNDILDISKIEAGKMRLTIEPCSPAALIEETKSLLEDRAKAKDLTITTTLGSGAEAMIASDPVRLRQVLVNLIGNAIKFTLAGSVRVTVERTVDSCDKEVVRFSVADTGKGVAPEKLGAIFQPFTQEDTSTQRQYGGTGLGLTITRQIIEQLGGQIAVSSGVNVGSEFVVTIPAVEPSEPTPVASAAEPYRAASPPAARVAPTTLRGRRILVAEDGPDNQRLIEYHLNRAGAEAHIVDNGLLAFEAACDAEAEFDAIILDMQMPIMDGYTAAASLRDAGDDRPLVALTAHTMEGDREKAISAGCDDYLAKPIDAAHLVDRLATLIDERLASRPSPETQLDMA